MDTFMMGPWMTTGKTTLVYWPKTIETSPYDGRDEFNLNTQPPGKLMKEGKLFQISGGLFVAAGVSTAPAELSDEVTQEMKP